MKEWRYSASLERLKAFVKLMRPRYTAQIVGIVAVFSIASHGVSVQSLYAILSALFLSIAIFLFDDAHDFESDRIVHRKRPIPKGYVTVRQAYSAGVVLLFIAVILASMLAFYQFAIFLASTIAASAIVFFNLPSVLRASIIASLIGALFPFGAFPDLKTLLFGLIVALPHFGGSIAKDFVHSTGDTIQGLKPPPDRSKYLASFAFFSAGTILWLPRILDFVTWAYVPPIIFTHISCIILGVSVLKGRYERVYIYGAIGMCSALAAFLLGGT